MWFKWFGVYLAISHAAMADPVGFVDGFNTLDQGWHAAHYDFGHPSFATDWRREQIEVGEGLRLSLKPHPERKGRYLGASVRREETSHYGLYEAVFQAAEGDGLVTGFFTYTGPHYGSRHDEIDIEILGRDTRKLHVAWFVDGKLTNHFVDLGFDAAAAPHHYAFEWQPDRLRWFANGELVFEHLAKDGPIPEMPSRLFANLWAADHSISNWAGKVKQQTEGQAHFWFVRFTPQS